RHHATRHTQHGGIQRAALRQSRWYDEVTKADWILVCDADEFLTVKVGDGSFAALIGASPIGAEVIGISWRIFGSAGIVGYEDRPVTQQFRRAEPEGAGGTYVKSLFRGLENIARIGIHMPHPRADLGRPLARCMAGGAPWKPVAGALILRAERGAAQMNHYALRSRDSFLVKRDRGRVNHAGQDMGEDYWRRFERTEVVCDAIRRHDGTTARWLAELHGDPILAALHARAVEWHRARVAELLARPDWAALALRLTAGQS
uniref:glycosyltransferase family 2 protein n=1 Tax=Phaeovulum sp. TaxID=2934796 RepID=UPI003567F2AC